MLRATVATAVAIAGCVVGFQTYAAEPATPAAPTEPETPEAQMLKDVQTDAAIAKAKLELAQSEIDLLKLKFGSIDTTNLPKGAAAITDMDLEGKLRAYAAARKSIDHIAADVAKSLGDDKRVVLATDAQLQALNQYRSFLIQIEELKKRSEEVLTGKPPELADPCAPAGARPLMSATAFATALVAVNSLLSVSALFKKDVELKGKEVTLDDFAMMTMMLQALKDRRITAVYPAAYYRLPQGTIEGEAMKKWKALYEYKKKLNDKASTYAEEYESLPQHANPDAACKKKIAALKARVDAYLSGLASAGKAIDEIGATLTKQDAQSGLTLISTYLVSERVENAITGAPVLQLKAVAAGGSTQTIKRAFSTKIAYGGGSILSYQLFAQDGTLQAAAVVPWYAGFIDAQEFKPGLVALP